LCAIFVFACHRLSRQAKAASAAEGKGGKGGGKGQGQGHNDDDAHGRSKKIAGTHNNIFLLSCCGDLSAISMDLMFFVWRFFLQFLG
jgi:hypothetical protein